MDHIAQSDATVPQRDKQLQKLLAEGRVSQAALSELQRLVE